MRTMVKSVKAFKPLLRELVEESLYEILGDPDEGLELKERIKAHLKKSFTQRKINGSSAKQVAHRLGLQW
ncbi:MAG: hypothetical protein A2W23_00565 [Planctomycetes bacterium RBG_16_43_13]|nr:MAG: hypothetical protein A2W23_00565 [Planctomycetes bacterium RBG_16_43_13]